MFYKSHKNKNKIQDWKSDQELFFSTTTTGPAKHQHPPVKVPHEWIEEVSGNWCKSVLHGHGLRPAATLAKPPCLALNTPLYYSLD